MDSHQRILVVQEDESLNRLVNQLLLNDYQLFFQSNINKVFRFIENNHIDLIIVNTRNSSGDPIELCRRAKMESDAKVIFLSSSNNILLKEKCFENGCDDFLSMPFFPKELELRVKRFLHDYPLQFTHIIYKRGIELHTQMKYLKLNNCRVFLSPTEFILLEYLLKQDKFHTSSSLLQYISARKNKQLSCASIIVLINRLRIKLEKGTGMEIIKTRYGLGYYISI